MINDLRFLVAQINPIVGDISGNCQRIEDIWASHDQQTDLIIFPEMVLSGYPTEDLVFKPSFVSTVKDQLDVLIAKSEDRTSAILVGAPWVQEGQLYNAVFLIDRGHVEIILKYDLPNYGVFDEARVFAPGPLPLPVLFRGTKLGIMICWDFWSPDAAKHLKENGAECLLIPNGSTYEATKMQRRLVEGRKRAEETGLPLLYVNLVGGHDELIFDGGSFHMDAAGELLWQAKAFEENIKFLGDANVMPYPETSKAMYSACVLGLRDYVEKVGFPGALLGLSGGIDSALTAVMAVDALGADRVRCVRLPSPFTSDHSMQDAEELAEILGVRLETVPIAPAMKAFEDTIEDLSGLAHENMQARTRGLILMSLSNQSGEMLLSTGNKSEIAVGYSTLYGDMCGGFNPLKDLYKTKVFELSRLRNEWKPNFAKGTDGDVIPERIITKPPSAELKDNQTDQDTLPPYDVLDQILEMLIEQEKSLQEISDAGFDGETVKRVYKMLNGAEYKRRQSAPGVNITTKSFGGRARRYPMVNKF